MKFIVETYGTEGDARPFAALCRGLMDAGHEARLLADGGPIDNRVFLRFCCDSRIHKLRDRRMKPFVT